VYKLPQGVFDRMFPASLWFLISVRFSITKHYGDVLFSLADSVVISQRVMPTHKGILLTLDNYKTWFFQMAFNCNCS